MAKKSLFIWGQHRIIKMLSESGRVYDIRYNYGDEHGYRLYMQTLLPLDKVFPLSEIHTGLYIRFLMC